jgi:SAM-dependent methyltransferase
MSEVNPYSYVGTELDLFSAATRWKSYVRAQLAPYLGAGLDVLEVGAGFGGTTRILCQGGERRWVCLEPDETLARRLASDVKTGALPACCETKVGTLETWRAPDLFDTVLYMDVLEHIEDDRAEVARAARVLRPGGHVVALSPAHPWLYSPFDRAIGHYRRYTRTTFGALAGEGLEPVRVAYLDAVGLLASLGNRLLLRKAMPTPRQVAFWDKVLVKCSMAVDPLIGHRAGKSVLAIWRKRDLGQARAA